MKEIVQCVALFNVIEKRLNRHTGSGKAGGTMHDPRVHQDYVRNSRFLLDRHNLTIIDIQMGDQVRFQTRSAYPR